MTLVELIEDGYCILDQPGIVEGITGSGIVVGAYSGGGLPQPVFKPLCTHAVKVTAGNVSGGRVDGSVLTVCGESFNIQGLQQQTAWKDQLLAPVGDRWIGDGAAPCENCKTALASLEWEDIRRSA